MSQLPPVLQGQPPEQTPPHIRALFAWADEAVAKAPQVLNESPRHAATLCVAILTGAAVLAAHLAAPTWLIGLALTALILGIMAALWGAVPREASMNTNDSDDIRKNRRRGLLVKMWCLRLAGLGMTIALAALAAALLFFGYKNPL